VPVCYSLAPLHLDLLTCAKMRTFVFLSVVALASATEGRLEQQGGCLVDSAEAVSDLMDSSMFIWASVARCGKGGELVKCEISVASAIESLNAMVNVILKALNTCDDLNINNKQCSMSAGVLTKATAGLTAATGGIVQKCFTPQKHAEANWAHAEPAMCVLDVKNTAKSLFKVIRSFMKLNSNCDGNAASRPCISNALSIVGAFAGMGEFLAGALGQCSTNGMKGARCAQESERLVHHLTKVAEAGVDMSKSCGEAEAGEAETALQDINIDDVGRLYATGAKSQASVGVSANLLLAAFLPVTAIASFVGGRFYANRATGTEQAREIMSDNE